MININRINLSIITIVSPVTTIMYISTFPVNAYYHFSHECTLLFPWMYISIMCITTFAITPFIRITVFTIIFINLIITDILITEIAIFIGTITCINLYDYRCSLYNDHQVMIIQASSLPRKHLLSWPNFVKMGSMGNFKIRISTGTAFQASIYIFVLQMIIL